MGVKYRNEYKAFDNSVWRIDISLDTYNSAIINIVSVSEQPAIPQYDPSDNDDIYSPYIKSSVDLSFYNRNNEMDISELQLAGDKDFKVTVYKDDVIYWKGFILSEGLSRPFTGSVETISLTATDGLSLLEDMPYVHKDLPVDYARTINTRCPINYIRQILFADVNLGNPLPIRWSNNIRCAAFNDDFFAGSVAWAVDNAGLYSYQSREFADLVQPQKCGYILEGFMRAIGARIYQAAGRWNIRRINLYPSKSFGYKQVQGDLGYINLVTGTDNIGKIIGTGTTGSYPFIKEDANILTDPGLKSCKVEYQANTRENILPNGSQDMVTSSSGRPYYWGLIAGSIGFANTNPSIDGRSGYSTKIYNSGTIGIDPPTYFVLNPESPSEFGLPVDAKILVQRIQFGFVFSIVSGFPLDGDGYVDFNTKPFKIQVILNTYYGTYYLNENGFWQILDTYIGIIPPDGTKVKPLDSVRIDFNRFQGILLPEPPDELDETKEYNIKVRFKAELKQEYFVDNIYINIEGNNDIYEAGITDTKNTKTEDLSLDISSSYGGYMLSNFMTGWQNSGQEFIFDEGAFTSGSLTSILARAVMRCKYAPQRKIDLTINVRGFNWTFDEFYSVVTFGTSVFVPVKATYNTETCEVKMTIIECRNDNVSLYTKHYGSNDSINSN